MATPYVNASIHAINPLLYRKRMKYGTFKDFTTISLLAEGELAFKVNPQVPATTVQEFISRARAAPAQFSLASTGVGSCGHIATLQSFHDARLTDIPLMLYKGTAPAVQDVLGGQLSAVVVPTTAVPLVKAGRLHALAVTSRERSEPLPDVPTMTEVGMKNIEFNSWYGFWGPAKLPPAVLQALGGRQGHGDAGRQGNTVSGRVRALVQEFRRRRKLHRYRHGAQSQVDGGCENDRRMSL